MTTEPNSEGRERQRTDNRPKFDAVSDAFVGFVEKGHTFRAAAALCGVSQDSVDRWLHKGRTDIMDGRENTPHAKFVKRVAMAKGRAQAVVEDALFGAAKRGNVSAMMRWLSTQARSDWGEKIVVQTTATPGGPQLSEASDEELRKLANDMLDAAERFLEAEA
jgi:hypothetical protein